MLEYRTFILLGIYCCGIKDKSQNSRETKKNKTMMLYAKVYVQIYPFGIID